LDIQGSIRTTTDEDFYSFQIQGPGTTKARIRTYQDLAAPDACATDDTELWLYNAIPLSLVATNVHQEPAIVAFDDDQGAGFCSQLGGDDVAHGVALGPGTYYLRVHRYAHEAVIPRYFVRIEL